MGAHRLTEMSPQVLSTLAFGFISDFRQAIVIRLVEGAVNGNTAMIRTMVSEVVKERRYVVPSFVRAKFD